MQGVFAMLQSKAQRHAEAWATYQAARQRAEQQHTASAAAAAAGSKSQLQAVSSSMEDVMSVLSEDKVMVLDEPQLKQVRHACLWHRMLCMPANSSRSCLQHLPCSSK
jgi:hypothetical protein